MLELEKDERGLLLILEKYPWEIVGYHCSIMYDYGLLKSFSAFAADNDPYYHLTASGINLKGYDFLDKIINDGTFEKTLSTIKEKELDMSIKTIGIIATAFITAVTEGQ